MKSARIGTFAATFLGAVFLVSVLAKIFDIQAFAEIVHARGLDRFLPAIAMAAIAVAVETLACVLLLLDVRRLWFLLPLTALIGFLLWINLHAYMAWSRGETPMTAACGCFGNLLDRTPAEALWQDALLVLPALFLSFVGRPGAPGPRVPKVRVGLAVAAMVAALVFAWVAPGLPLDDLPFVTRLHTGVGVDALCVGKGEERTCLTDADVAPEIATGRHLVVLADLSDEAFAASIRTFAGTELARDGFIVVHAGTPEDLIAFDTRLEGMAVDVRRAPYALLRSLYRTLPRSFLVEDGKVVRTWTRLPQ